MHVPDHILSTLIGTSRVSMQVERGLLLLGTWQRVILVELEARAKGKWWWDLWKRFRAVSR